MLRLHEDPCPVNRLEGRLSLILSEPSPAPAWTERFHARPGRDPQG